ncbi:hypothetical protein Pcinc_012067 [Petrolisthes cinctipes]|uniref:C3H1-type domain-containing protein n=1 Tax=Petrolisthes cinctipes TaxID=88211 RepID=A0AAE1KRV6_PETCI|nr:hypothetical protein Pcinc_012067 [Petrolisthes cinctipes]
MSSKETSKTGVKPGTAKTEVKSETSKAEAKPYMSKTGVKPKVPVTAPEPDMSNDASKDAKKPAPKRDIKQVSTDSKKKEPVGNRNRTHADADQSSNRQSKEVCRLYLKHQCKRGSHCKYIHPKSSDRQYESRRRSRSPGHVHVSGGSSASGTVVCRDFLRNMCHRGANCRFFHPPLEVHGGHQQQVSWFIICQDFLSGICMRPNCSYFHVSKQDEEMYRMGGEISPQLVEQAVQKSLVENLSLIGARPCCKEFLRGLCTMPNCRLRHLSQREYEDEVFYALLEEFKYLFDRREPRPFSPSVGNFYEPQGNIHDPIHPSNQMMPGYPDDMMTMNEEPGRMEPHPDYEPERKRFRYYPDDAGFPVEERSRWDDPVDYDRERAQFPIEGDGLMQEIVMLRNDNMEMKREAERKFEELRKEINRHTQENSKLHADAIEMSLAHKAEMKTLTQTNTTLIEDRQNAVRQLEIENGDLHNKVKSLKSELDATKMDVTKARETFTKVNAMLRQSEDERSKLVAELGNLKGKLRDMKSNVPTGKDVQQYNNKSGYSRRDARDGYSRDMDRQGMWNEGGGGGMGQQDWNRSNTWEEDMRTMDILSQENRNKAAGDNRGGHYGTYGYSTRVEDPVSQNQHIDNSRMTSWPPGGSGGINEGHWSSQNDPNLSNSNQNMRPGDNRGYITQGNNRDNRNQYNTNTSGRPYGGWQ